MGSYSYVSKYYIFKANFHFIKILSQIFLALFIFIKYSKTTCQKHHLQVNIQNLKNNWYIFKRKQISGL